ncbi:oligopeptide transport ATP-binding protein OppF [Clostridiales bacterium]|nr:oligopeptide transport ATP-binding protein OppF [Clostridiales bacterium]
MSDKLVQVEHLRQYFPAGGFGKNKKYVQAVDDVSFYINRGETLGLVGESGCGKTTTGRTLLRLYEPTGGKFTYDGTVIFDVENKVSVDMLPYRKRMQIVFQDPYASLDPRMTVGDIVGEAIDVHKLAANKQERYDIIIEMLRRAALLSCKPYPPSENEKVSAPCLLRIPPHEFHSFWPTENAQIHEKLQSTQILI